MKVHHRSLLGILVFVLIGLIGCSEAPTPNSASRLRHLQSQNARLEQDYRASVAELVKLRKQVSELVQQTQENKQKQREELEQVAKERDELRQQLNVCEGQRDALRSQLVNFSRDLQSLVGKIEQVATNRNKGVIASTVSMQSTP